LGVLTLINNTTGANNQAVGHSALQHNTTGIYNSAVGYTALQAGTTGSYNTALGSSALINNTTGANNIAVGYAAGARNTTLSNRLFIGSIARNDLNEDSTMALLFGYMDEDPALQKLVVNGKLGVGTSTPRGTLDVVGDETYLSSGYIEMGANAARFATMGTGSMTLGDRDNLFQGNNFTIDNGSDLNFFTNNSLDTKLGVNTAHPDSALHIVGGLKFVTGRQGAGKVLTSNASGGADWSTLSGAGIGTVTSVATGLGLSGGTITSTGTILLDTASSSVISRQRAAATYLPLAGGTLTGNLGIGVSPSYRLDVSGSTSTARFYDQTASTGRTQVRIRDGAGQSGNESLVIVENSDNPANNGIRFYAGAAFFNTSGIARYMNAGVDVMPSTGVYRWVNGTTNPFGTIDLSMSRVRAKWLAIGSSATVGDSTGSVTMDSLRVKSLAHFAGNVGIGTTSPTSLLHTAGSFATAYVAKTANYTATISDYTIHFTSGTSTFTLPTAVGITGRIYVVRNDSGNTLTLATTSSQTIDGAAPGTQATGTVKQYQSTGANWISLN